ncbi:hypothetical protein [Stutzerimonas nitrititolerans]|uniref:hypothetical protein n=1 Tax=Stutzerimonas nitrititolerans TaxID=2482751 RepID=UPI0028A6FD28|nr:hypothetical protein [Stutzerimonas nitrititolerans]
MKNPEDYAAGWTKKTINPKTGKSPSGGAARNLRLAKMGGAEALFNSGGIHALSQITPLVQQLQSQLAASQLMNEEMAKRLSKGKANRL